MIWTVSQGINISDYCQAMPPSKHIHPTARTFVGLLPKHNKLDRVEALMFYVDGAYWPTSGRGAWAVAAVGWIQGKWRWVGYLTGELTDEIWGPGERSAFQPELCAHLVAQTTAIAAGVPFTLTYDSTSAADCACALSACRADYALTEAMVTTFAMLTSTGQVRGYQHTKSHQGHPGNELVDSLATACLAEVLPPEGSLAPFLFTAIHCPEFSWLWLSTVHHYSSWPTIGPDGITEPSQPQGLCMHVASPSRWAPADTSTIEPQQFRLDVCIASYNAMTLASALQRQCVHQAMKSLKIGVLGLQETREDTEPLVVRQGVWRFASKGEHGQLGCQLWVDSTRPAGFTASGDSVPWQLDTFAARFMHPRLLLISGQFGSIKCLFIVGHAPTSTSPDEVINAWWDLLREQVNRHIAGHVPLFMLDANARFDKSEEPTGLNAHRLAACLEAWHLARTPAWDNGHAITTWRSPNGKQACLDYVCVPADWQVGLNRPSTHDILDVNAGIDHKLLKVSVAASLIVARKARLTRLDVEAIHSPAGRIELQRILNQAPQVPWEVDVDDHLHVLNCYLNSAIAQSFVRPREAARSPVLSHHTMTCLQQRRAARFVHRCRRQRLERLQAYIYFMAWREACGHGQSRQLQHASARQQRRNLQKKLAEHFLRMRELNKELKRTHQRDQAVFARQMYQDARAKGPRHLAHVLRAVLRTGRRYKAPRMAPVLEIDGQMEQDAARVALAFGDHFAKAERATSRQLQEVLLEKRAQARPAEEVDLHSAPTLAQLTRAFASMPARRAPGLSTLPPDIYCRAPLQMALAHMPLMLKLAARDVAPMLWSGSIAIPMAKPNKAHHEPAGFRSISLFEISSKAVARSLRPELSKGLEAITLEGTAGARTGIALGVPALVTQTHLQRLHRSATSGAVVFVDGASAFYSTLREYLLRTDVQNAEAWLDDMPISLELRLRIGRVLRSGSLMKEIGLPETTQRMLEALMRGTWFTVNAEDTSVRATLAGTSPGSPVADSLFQLIFVLSLRGISEHLAAMGIGAQIHVPGHVEDTPLIPTWMDDIAVLIQVTRANELIRAVSATSAVVKQQLAIIGVNINLQRGKTEAMLVFKGPQAKAERHRLWIEDNGVIPFKVPGEMDSHICCTDQYVHLGSLRTCSAADWKDIDRRAKLAEPTFVKVRAHILRNHNLTWDERKGLLISLVLRKFMHGANTWTLKTQRERAKYESSYMSFVRRAMRPMTGLSTKLLSDEQVCDYLQVLQPLQALAVERVRLLLQIAHAGPRQLQLALVAAQAWIVAAWHDLQLIGRLVGENVPECPKETPSCMKAWNDVWKTPAATARFLRQARGKWLQIAGVARPAVKAKAEAIRGIDETPAFLIKLRGDQSSQPFACQICSRSFSKACALASHMAKTHQQPALATRIRVGSTCEVCQRQYWTSKRLREHLRHSLRCCRIYHQADMASDLADKPDNAHLPQTRLIGPQPWWATQAPDKSPTPPDVALASTPTTRDTLLSSFCQLADPKQLQGFFNVWVGSVEESPKATEEKWRPPGPCANSVQQLAMLGMIVFDPVQQGRQFASLQQGKCKAVCTGQHLLVGEAADLTLERCHAWLSAIEGA